MAEQFFFLNVDFDNIQIAEAKGKGLYPQGTVREKFAVEILQQEQRTHGAGRMWSCRSEQPVSLVILPKWEAHCSTEFKSNLKCWGGEGHSVCLTPWSEGTFPFGLLHTEVPGNYKERSATLIQRVEATETNVWLRNVIRSIKAQYQLSLSLAWSIGAQWCTLRLLKCSSPPFIKLAKFGDWPTSIEHVAGARNAAALSVDGRWLCSEQIACTLGGSHALGQ